MNPESDPNPRAAFHIKRIERLRKTLSLPPPWKTHPQARAWNMGNEETTMWDWQDWFRSLLPMDRERYARANPLPTWVAWNFYKAITEGLPTRQEDDNDGSLYWRSLRQQYRIKD